MIRRIMLLGLVAGILTLLVLCISLARGSARQIHQCTHGESSIVANYRHGKFIVGHAHVTGCTP